MTLVELGRFDRQELVWRNGRKSISSHNAFR